MFCTSCDWDTSLFESFEASACAVIRKPQELAMRMNAASKSKLADWYFHASAAAYNANDTFYPLGLDGKRLSALRANATE